MSMLTRKRVAPCHFQDIRSHIENPRRIPIECSCLVSDMVVHCWSGHGKEMKIPCWISCKNQRGTVLSGFIKLPILGGIKQYQYMIILRDFRFFLVGDISWPLLPEVTTWRAWATPKKDRDRTQCLGASKKVTFEDWRCWKRPWFRVGDVAVFWGQVLKPWSNLKH